MPKVVSRGILRSGKKTCTDALTEYPLGSETYDLEYVLLFAGPSNVGKVWIIEEGKNVEEGGPLDSGSMPMIALPAVRLSQIRVIAESAGDVVSYIGLQRPYEP